MTFDPNDFSNTTQPRRTCIANANGATYLVTGAGIVPLSPSLSLAHTLLVPYLSNKLMSVSQVTKELNCVVLIYSTICLLQDVLNKKIIGCGTKRRGLYSLDDFSPSKANHMHHQTSSHAKFGYGKGTWGIHHLAISGIYSHIYFPFCRMWTLNVIHVLRLKANEFLIQLA